jgi:hypothetical protein
MPRTEIERERSLEHPSAASDLGETSQEALEQDTLA